MRISSWIVLLALVGCAPNLREATGASGALAVNTGGPWSSTIYLGMTEGGAVAFDLGVDGDGSALREGLERIGADTGELAAVFLTHSHRDHMAAWRSARGAPFHVAASEVPALTGVADHRGLVPRFVESIDPFDRPSPGTLELRLFWSDTAFVIGADTIHAYPLPGHTAGSAAYLFRDVLFVGDAVGYTPLIGFHGAKGIYSDDAERSDHALAGLPARLRGRDVLWVCTAHGKCARPWEVFEGWSAEH
ncbi:MAG: MBL fold metallo-hydrolase [Longimicrobiales bacterium]